MATRRQVDRLHEARALYEAGRLADADAACRDILGRDKKNVNAWQLRGLIANRRGWFDKAAPCFEKCVKLRPDDPMSHCQLASARMYQGRFDEALAGFERALAKRPADPVATRGKAELLERRGDLEEALALLRPAAERHPEDGEAALLLASLTEKVGRPDDALEIVRRALDRPALQPMTRRKLWFVSGRAHDRLKRYDEAFDAYRAGNTITARPFDIGAIVARNDRLRELFASSCKAELPRADEPSELPVFIVGMPRSGSTLVEQIIDAHPQAYGAGELTTFTDLVSELPARIGSTRRYPDWIEDLEAGRIDRLGRPYLAHVGRLARDATRIADKNLLNSTHLGLISLLLPAARVIVCRRDPLDNAVSCFMNDLSPVGFPWSGDLGDIGRYLREHARLMDFWLEALDAPMLSVSYEELVDDSELVSRRIIDFCGLEWDASCLEFHKTGRAVTTLSYDQVRKPIYRTAMKRYERYEEHLGPLRAALEGE